MPNSPDTEFLEAALAGYQCKLTEIEGRMAELRARIAGPSHSAKPAAAPASPAREKPAAVPYSKDDFKNDPLIKKALEIFKGQIVEVRA